MNAREALPNPNAQVQIDPNVRVLGQHTFVGLEDVDGFVAEGDAVTVHEPESGLTGSGRVTRIDEAAGLVYLEVDWQNMVISAA